MPFGEKVNCYKCNKEESFMWHPSNKGEQATLSQALIILLLDSMFYHAQICPSVSSIINFTFNCHNQQHSQYLTQRAKEMYERHLPRRVEWTRQQTVLHQTSKLKRYDSFDEFSRLTCATVYLELNLFKLFVHIDIQQFYNQPRPRL